MTFNSGDLVCFDNEFFMSNPNFSKSPFNIEYYELKYGFLGVIVDLFDSCEYDSTKTFIVIPLIINSDFKHANISSQSNYISDREKEEKWHKVSPKSYSFVLSSNLYKMLKKL